MNGVIHLMVADRDESLATEVRVAVAVESSVRVLTAPTAQDAIAVARQVKPEIVLVGQHVQGLNPLALCQSLRALPELERATLVLVLDARSSLGETAALQAGAEYAFSRPFDPAALRVLVSNFKLRRQVNAERQAAEMVISELQRQLADSTSHLDGLLTRLVETRRPGAAERSQRVEELVMRLASRFGVPPEHLAELVRAARLIELGEVITPDEAIAGNAQEARWMKGRTAALLLASLPGYQMAAELLEAVHENWDGTGHPDHRQQGQIPLRSRLLRVVLDFLAGMEAPGHPSAARVLEHMQDHVGTLYDPMTIVHLKALLEGGSDEDLRGRVVRLPVDRLHVGMVLSEDLVTDSGLKLLSRGTRITLETLDVIQRRHTLEPIVNGAAVRRDSTAA